MKDLRSVAVENLPVMLDFEEEMLDNSLRKLDLSVGE